jgi:hypothetical protein
MISFEDYISFQTAAYSSRPLKSDFMTYCIDLHRLESGHLDFTNHMGFSFADLFESMITENPIAIEWLSQASTVVVAHATYDFDPDYAHIAAYIQNRVCLMGRVMSISSATDTLFDHASLIVAAYLTPGQNGAIVTFEQAVLPLKESAETPSPVCSKASVWLVSCPSTSHNAERILHFSR